MSVPPETIPPAPAAGSLPLRLLRNPLVRLLLFLVMTGVFSWLLRMAIPLPKLELDAQLAARGSDLWLRSLRGLVPTVLAYYLLVRVIEARRVTEFAPRKFPTHVPVGWLVGMGVLLLSAGAMALFGAYSVHGMNSGAYLLGPLLVLGILPGVTEEIVSRGVLLRVVEDGLGTWIALGISAILFGAGHLANPNATIWSSTAIAIEAGLLLGMAYVATRSLWFCAGLHAAWNFTQGAILGIPVSGIAVTGLFDSSSQGAELVSGGRFGAEASILTVFICVAVAGYFTRRALAAGQIRKPVWRPLRVYLILAGVYVLVAALAILAGRAQPKLMPVVMTLVVALPLLFALGAAPAPSRGAGPREGDAAWDPEKASA